MGSCCVREVSSDLPQDKPASQPSPVPSPPDSVTQLPAKRALTVQTTTSHKREDTGEAKSCPKVRRQKSDSGEGKVDSNRLFKLDIPVMQIHRPFEDVYEAKTANGPGQLFLAVHKSTKATYMVKKLPRLSSRKSSNPEMELQSRLEALLHISHPGILQADAVFYNRREMFAVSENLTRVKVVEYSEIAEKLTESVVKRLAVQLFRTVAYIHAQNLVLKTLSMASILFYICNDRDIGLKLLSIGEWECNTKKVTLKNKAFYTAPEAFSGQFTAESDLWSCGVILYLFLTGTLPFSGQDAESLREAIRKEAEFPASLWNRFDPQGKKLVEDLLNESPRSRPTAVECLKHPWLRDLTCAPSSLPVVMANMRKFQGTKPFKLAILSFLARNVLSLVDKQPLDDVFAYINVSNSGFLTPTELVQAFAQVNRAELSPMLASRVLQALHLPPLSPLSYSQFLLLTADLSVLTKTNHLKVAFALLDPDSSGSISVRDWQMALNFKGRDEDWREIMSDWDRNDNGTCSFADFVKLARGIVDEVRGFA